MLGEDEPDWLAGANCGGCKSRATKRSKRSLQLDSCPPLVPGSAGNAADVTTARLERSLRLGTWQEGKRSVPRATWFLPLLLFARNLLALCALVHVFLDVWTELPSCQVAKLPNWRVSRQTLCSSAVAWCGCLWSMYCPLRGISAQNERTEAENTTCRILLATNLLIKKSD